VIFAPLNTRSSSALIAGRVRHVKAIRARSFQCGPCNLSHHQPTTSRTRWICAHHYVFAKWCHYEPDGV
jgi:hypothetical protein